MKATAKPDVEGSAYSCACIADKTKVTWKKALACPSGTFPFSPDINACRVTREPDTNSPSSGSIGWIDTGQ